MLSLRHDLEDELEESDIGFRSLPVGHLDSLPEDLVPASASPSIPSDARGSAPNGSEAMTRVI